MIEEGFLCSRSDAASPDICISLCGNSIRENGESSSYIEECDDGSRDNDDGCSSTCKVETGMTCNRTGLLSEPIPDVCSEYCGDGLVVGSEQCDPLNPQNGQCGDDCLCSRFAEFSEESQSCICVEEHCTECITSKCSSCGEGYSARHGVTCSLADQTIGAVATAGASALGVLLAMGLTTSIFTGAATVVWSAFEVLQIIELVAMVDFNCPENFD